MIPTGGGVYIAGPMTRIAAFNFPTFFEVETVVVDSLRPGKVFNPARHDIETHGLEDLLLTEGPAACGQYLLDHPHKFSMREAMGADLAWIARNAYAIVLLPGWENSAGANAEVALGKSLGLTFYQATLQEVRDGYGALVQRYWWLDTLLAQDLPPLGARILPYSPLQDEAPVAFTPPDVLLQQQIDANEEKLAKTEETVRHSFGLEDLDTPSFERVGDIDFDEIVDPDVAREFVNEEVRKVSETGGEKGVKSERWDLLPMGALAKVAEHFGRGAAKYADHNWRRGYPWSRSYGAAGRHYRAFVEGEDYDRCPEDGHGCRHTDMEGNPYKGPVPGTCFNHTGSLHIVAFAWHALVLIEFFEQHQQYDDRFVYDGVRNTDPFADVD